MRPGGLTALSIFNFIFGGLGGLLHLISIATIQMQHTAVEKSYEVMGAEPPSMGFMYLIETFAIVRVALLIVSGVGYLGQRKIIGRLFGNIYAVLALVAIPIEMFKNPLGFKSTSLLEFAYPLITLFLLNFVFRRDLVR